MKNKLILGLIIIIAFTLRCYRLDYKPLHFDEKASLGCAYGIPISGFSIGCSSWNDLGIDKSCLTPKDFLKNNTYYGVYKATLEDNGSIFYFSFLHIWVNVFGGSIFSVRFLSLLFSCLTVLLIYFFVLKISQSSLLGLLSSFILAIHPISIESGQFGRSHAMAGFFALAATYLFYKLIVDKDTSLKNIVIYGLLCGISMLCHYFTMYIFLGHVLYMILKVRNRKLFTVFILGGLIGGAILFTWLFLGGFEALKMLNAVSEGYSAIAFDWKEGDNPYFMPSTIINMFAGVIQTLLPLFGNYMQNLGFRLSQLLFLLIILLFLISYNLFKYKKDIKFNQPLMFLFVMIISYQIWAIVISMLTGYIIYFEPHYSQYLAPYGAVIIAYAIYGGFFQSKKIINYLLIIILIITFLPSVYSIFNNSIYSGEKYENVAKEINDLNTKETTITFSNFDDAFFTSILLENQNINIAIDSKANQTIINK